MHKSTTANISKQASTPADHVPLTDNQVLDKAAVILAHNHPSGIAEPSQADIAITKKLADALALIDVKVLDHLIVGDSVISFAEKGLM